MTENIRVDSHKLIYHPDAVARWMRGEVVYPIEIEISPSGACNDRCVFCALDYLGYEPAFLKKDVIIRDIRQMSERGLKSVVCAGEGEPLLNRDMADIANSIKSYGVDVAMSTNAVLLTREVSEECLGAFTWIRFSIASMEERSYQEIQRGREGDLDRVRDNLCDAVRVKRDRGLKTTLGVQCILLPQNMAQLSDMARQLREIGVDYLTIKPYMQNKHSERKFQLDYDSLLDLEEELGQYETEDFKVYFRANAMKNVGHEKKYHSCWGLPFMAHIDAHGNVWPCVAHIGDEEYRYGNIYEQTFEEIWEGERRIEVAQKIGDPSVNETCSLACRLDSINQYLDELKHPGGHVNFI